MVEIQGWVYFIQSEIGGLIKIGWAKDLEKRLEQIQLLNPFELKVLHRFEGTRFDESKMHSRFAMQRTHGEWFEPGSDLTYYIVEQGGAAPLPYRIKDARD